MVEQGGFARTGCRGKDKDFPLFIIDVGAVGGSHYATVPFVL
jgi:hypothetical protein